MLQSPSGINVLDHYSPTIFQSIGFTDTSVGLLATGVFGLVKAFANVLFMFLGVDRLGRRRSLLIGSVGAMVTMFYLAGLTKMSHSLKGHLKRSVGAYVAIVITYVFAVFYAMSWNAIPCIFCVETFPIALQSVCLVTTCTQWLGQFIVVYSTPYLLALYFMLETKGLTFEDVDIMLNLNGLAHNMRPETDHIIASNRQELVTGMANDYMMVGKFGAKHVKDV